MIDWLKYKNFRRRHFFTMQKQILSILLFVDFEKAFDSLNWNIFFKTLEHINVCKSWLATSKQCTTIYNQLSWTMIILVHFFNLQSGVRQGCPLSEYLFIRTLETLANKIRNDNSIKGIKIDNKEIKISLLANDITLILSDSN